MHLLVYSFQNSRTACIKQASLLVVRQLADASIQHVQAGVLTCSRGVVLQLKLLSQHICHSNCVPTWTNQLLINSMYLFVHVVELPRHLRADMDRQCINISA